MNLFPLKKISLFGLCLLASLSVNAQPVAQRAVIHRAVEPAQMLLDISLNDDSLTLYLTIPGSVVQLLSSDNNYQKMVTLLTDTNNLWQMPPKADCSLKTRRIFASASIHNQQMAEGIQGFFDFHCSAPEALHSIKPDLNKIFPGLKQLNIWITTDHWQNKQSLQVPNGTIEMQSNS